MSNPSRRSRILGPLDEQDLQNRGLLGPVIPDGTRRLHRRRLNRSSDEENQDIPLNISITSPEAAKAFASIPDQLISRATLMYLGFNVQQATLIWSKWCNWPDDCPPREVDPPSWAPPVTFIDFIISFVDDRHDTWSNDNHAWIACMSSSGLSSEFQEAILDPRFASIRLRETCIFWVKDTLEIRYGALNEVQQTSMQREAELQGNQTKTSGQLRASSGRGGSSQASSRGGVGSSNSRGQQNTPAAGPSQQNFFNTASASVSTSTSAAQSIAARNAPGYTTLWRSIEAHRCVGLLDDQGRLSEDIEDFLSRAPSDFSPDSNMIYFSAEIRVAQFYASYSRRRENIGAVVIVEVKIPNAALETLQAPKKLSLWFPNPEWRELIWYCRRGKRNFPEHLQKYKEATLIISSVAGRPNKYFNKIKQWTDVTEHELLKIGSQELVASQYAFSSSKGGDFLHDNAESITIHPYNHTEYREWLDQN